MFHICVLCVGSGKFERKPCPLCARSWKTIGMRTAKELGQHIPSNAVVKRDPLLFHNYESRQRLLPEESYYSMDSGGLILDKPTSPIEFKTQIRGLEIIGSAGVPNKQIKIDIFRDRESGISHIYKLVYDDLEWRAGILKPETAEAILHIGVFKDLKCAKDYLKKREKIDI